MAAPGVLGFQYNEGWALYAERLMAELGYLDDPGERMEMLDAQRLRAARVVIDIGEHCGLTAPNRGVWDANQAWNFLPTHCALAPARSCNSNGTAVLAGRGQAASYAIGQRIRQRLREQIVTTECRSRDFTAGHSIWEGSDWPYSMPRCSANAAGAVSY
ncbi:DUF885 family protein [Mycobacterium sp.]|uniref:DUF885 family protein n=1 Tax=Mycobacterium sp. TaxID=1785 RepID=UPI002B834A84|nr:DUF885 family protein [Mycobacterium sp.]HTY33952.1 DUF885 family protein [Mycobacterium sp.]